MTSLSSRRTPSTERVAEGTRARRILLTTTRWERNRILRCSIFRFKGLERMVVGLCELDGAREQALYVGVSRPSVFLALFTPKSVAHRLA